MPPTSRGPVLVKPQPGNPHHSILALWHLLSLDAPSVAALWTLFIARASGIALPWTAPAAMFLAVWIIYAADRLLDARQLDPQTSATTPDATPLTPPLRASTNLNHQTHHNADLEARHRFHHLHRSRFLTAIVLSAFALVDLLHHIETIALHLYVLLATLLGVWMLLIHARPIPSGQTRRLPKELAVGIFFPAAVFIPTVARLPSLRPQLLPAAALFACVCTLNCLYLYAWEHPAPRLHAHWTTRWSTRRLTPIAAAMLTLAALAAILAAAAHLPTVALPATACALSIAALILLDATRTRLAPVHLRASADLVLLTPLLILPFIPLLAR
ncbi:MAG: hypothetical protein HIU91_15805 [Acidobacteria bacterium]|nr:hypothetical protein [Acidobacteriota bacterium]